jgi:glycosyltransferase involved in cell wall biosynthesis
MRRLKPRVSIGMPVFNAARYLGQAVDSILAQTYSEFELIISDNASTDGTDEICRAYAAKDSRIRYHRNSTNLGAAPNFNRVFELSSTEYFKWAPHDDMIAPDFLSRCVLVLDENPAVVLCYSRAQIIDEDSRFVTDYDPGPDTSSTSRHERFRNLILQPEYAIQQMGLIRSRALRKTVLHRSFPSSDEVLLADLALRGQFYEIRDRLYFYRRHDQQSTQEPKQRARVLFFDTSLAGRIVLPKWLYLLDCLRVVRWVPISRREQTKCYLTMVRWLLVPAHLRALAKDLLVAAYQYAACIPSKCLQFSRSFQATSDNVSFTSHRDCAESLSAHGRGEVKHDL